MPDLTASIEAVEQPLDQDTCDAICALWKSEGAEIDDLEERLSQIAFVAYAGGDLVGITSRTIDSGATHTTAPVFTACAG